MMTLVLSTLDSITAAAELTGYAALTTDYVRRGVSQSDGHLALQVGVDIAMTSGVFVGAWGSTVDIDNGPPRQRDLELNLYAGYAYELSDSWRLSAHIVSYEYPGQTGPTDYGYQEYSVNINYEDRIWLEYSYSPDLYHSGLSSNNVDLYGEWPVSNTWSVGGGGGNYDTSTLTGRDYWYWHLGTTGSFTHVDIDFRFHDTDRWVPIISSPDLADGRFAVTIRFPF